MTYFVLIGDLSPRVLPMESFSMSDLRSQKLFIGRWIKGRYRCGFWKHSLDSILISFPTPSWPIRRKGLELLEEPHVLSLWIDLHLWLSMFCVHLHLLFSRVELLYCMSFIWIILLEKGDFSLPFWFPANLRDHPGWKLSPEEPSSRVCKLVLNVTSEDLHGFGIRPPLLLQPRFYNLLPVEDTWELNTFTEFWALWVGPIKVGFIVK